ncbi:MAG: hypothetical protein HYZ54_07915 [Ignavibacteriae bacterium]|nr:hypothetical protein [Ignavibacteriota bacterium]
MFKLRFLSYVGAACIAIASLSSCAITYPVSATSNPLGSKVGVSSGMGILGAIVLSPDSGIQQAAKNGGITKISTVDFKVTNILGIYQTYTCTITGE